MRKAAYDAHVDLLIKSGKSFYKEFCIALTLFMLAVSIYFINGTTSYIYGFNVVDWIAYIGIFFFCVSAVDLGYVIYYTICVLKLYSDEKDR